jgi:hypothetical protein
VEKTKAAKTPEDTGSKQDKSGSNAAKTTAKPPEHGGPKGLEPTRYGDWERKGIAVDF